MYKRISTVIIIFVFVFSISTSVFAHPASQQGVLAVSYNSHHTSPGYYVGGDEVGWSIDENCHSNSTTITWSFQTGSYFNNSIEAAVREGAQKWLSVTNFSVYFEEKADGTGTGKIYTYYGSTYTLAGFTEASTNSNGHLLSWKIRLNLNYIINSSVIAHEFGHAIGLNDIGSGSNSNKLMYYQYDDVLQPNKYPTTTDRRGASVIIGQHTTHTWGYKYYSTNSAGNKHVKYCMQCGGYTTTIEYCTYNSANVCIKCGTPKGSSPTAITIPIYCLQRQRIITLNDRSRCNQ